MDRMNIQPIIPDILLRVPPATRTCICLLLLLSYLAASVSCNTCGTITTQDWAITTPYIHEVNYTWIINDWLTVAFKLEENHALVSPYFSPPSAPEFAFQLKIYPKNPLFPEYVVVMFNYMKGTVIIHETVTFTVIDKTCKGVLTSGARESNGNQDVYKIAERKWFENNANTILTSSGQLRLLMSAFIQHTNHSYGGQCKNLTVDETSKVCSLEKYQANDTYADGSIVAKDGKEIPVHKVLMAAQSSVLAEAYLTDDTFQADNIDSDTMEEVLCYIYCNEPHHMDRLAVKLLVAANSLKINGLKMLCEAELCGRINATNAYEIYAVASKYNAERLRKKAAEYIASNQAEVMKSDSFREISQQHPVCVSDLMSIK